MEPREPEVQNRKIRIGRELLVSKIRGKTPKMDGENNGKPY